MVGFRIKVSCETIKWLTYAVIKKKRRHEILAYSEESVTQYDLWPLRAFRRVLQLIIPALCSEVQQ